MKVYRRLCGPSNVHSYQVFQNVLLVVMATCLNNTIMRQLFFIFSFIIALGDQDESHRLDSVEIYDIAHNMWTAKATMPQALRCFTAVSFRGSLYVFGGETQHEIVNLAYR